MVCLHGLYLVLQSLYRFLVVGYLPMQDAVLPLQCLDLVAPEKRADTLGDSFMTGFIGSLFQNRTPLIAVANLTNAMTRKS